MLPCHVFCIECKKGRKLGHHPSEGDVSYLGIIVAASNLVRLVDARKRAGKLNLHYYEHQETSIASASMVRLDLSASPRSSAKTVCDAHLMREHEKHAQHYLVHLC